MRPDPLELAAGWIFGTVPGPAPIGRPGARAALEGVLLESLGAAPTYVAFSGGRDSSVVLAVAVHVARQQGLPDPVPVTLRFPGLPATDESAWQDRVLEHLGVTERLVITVTDQHRLLGERARAGLSARGLVFPAPLQFAGVVLEPVAGGHLLTGEGGDDVLARRRGTPLRLLRRDLRRGTVPSRALLREIWVALTATSRSVGEGYRRLLGPWMSDAAAQEAGRLMGAAQHSSLRWDVATRQVLTSRCTAVVVHNLDLVAREHGAVYVHPLLDPRFVDALAVDGGRWGYAGRTDVLRHQFGDLLPDEVLSRRSKAVFNHSRWGEEEEAFAREWDGTGLPEFVDAETLREVWLSPVRPWASGLLLQAAWLAGRRSS